MDEDVVDVVDEGLLVTIWDVVLIDITDEEVTFNKVVPSRGAVVVFDIMVENAVLFIEGVLDRVVDVAFDVIEENRVLLIESVLERGVNVVFDFIVESELKLVERSLVIGIGVLAGKVNDQVPFGDNRELDGKGVKDPPCTLLDVVVIIEALDEGMIVGMEQTCLF